MGVPLKRIGPLVIVLIVAVMATAPTALAFYQWVDEQGNLHVTDHPPPGKTAPQEPAAPTGQPAQQSPAPRGAQPAPAASQPTATVAAPAVTTKSASTVLSTVVTKTVPSGAPAAATAISLTAPAVTTSPVVSVPTASAGSAASLETATPGIPGPIAPAPTGAGQESRAVEMAAFAAGFIIVLVAVVVLFYLYFSFCLYRIAKRQNLDEAWAAWVPILQLWPFVTAAGKPVWWTILLFIPLVNAVLSVYLWMCISENLGKGKWLGLFMLVPLANLVLPGYLAFSRSEAG